MAKNAERYGFDDKDIKGIRSPVLVRECLSKVDRVAFASQAVSHSLGPTWEMEDKLSPT